MVLLGRIAGISGIWAGCFNLSYVGKKYPSIESGLFAAQAFDFRTPRFCVEPPPARGLGRLRRAARNRGRRGLADHLDQAFARVLAVLLLAAVAQRGDHDHALAR